MTRHVSRLIKSAAVAGSVLSAGILLAVPALAQTSSDSYETDGSYQQEEIELSPEAFEILCERSPLNSRCEGGSTEARDYRTLPEQQDRVDPTETDPAEAVRDPEAAPVDRDGEMTSPSYEAPGSTTSPDMGQ